MRWSTTASSFVTIQNKVSKVFEFHQNCRGVKYFYHRDFKIIKISEFCIKEHLR